MTPRELGFRFGRAADFGLLQISQAILRIMQGPRQFHRATSLSVASFPIPLAPGYPSSTLLPTASRPMTFPVVAAVSGLLLLCLDTCFVRLR